MATTQERLSDEQIETRAVQLANARHHGMSNQALAEELLSEVRASRAAAAAPSSRAGRRSPTDTELDEMFEHSKNDHWIWVGSDIRVLIGEIRALRALAAPSSRAGEETNHVAAVPVAAPVDPPRSSEDVAAVAALDAVSAQGLPPTTTAGRCACGRFGLGADEAVDDNNRKVHTLVRCGFDVPIPGYLSSPGDASEETADEAEVQIAVVSPALMLAMVQGDWREGAIKFCAPGHAQGEFRAYVLCWPWPWLRDGEDGPEQAIARFRAGEDARTPRTASKETGAPRCACGHLHAAGTDGEDGGCRECGCLEWRPVPGDLPAPRDATGETER
jgi:hypothetical protein